MSYAEYRASKRFPALDGLRAVSILLVVVFHVGSATFVWANGRLGVAVFFVLSGYLITTLLLRENERDGRISVSGFYLRRAFRILPLYYVVLALYVVLYMGIGLGGRGELRHSLPWFLTYMNDFRPGILGGSTPYTQSWSLGVEEKFYFVWPLLAFVLLPRFRTQVAAIAAAVPVLLYALGVAPWFAYYGQIMVGCLLAVALNRPVGFRVLTLAARGPFAIAAAVVLLVLERQHHVLSLAFPVAAAVVLAGLVTGGPGTWLLSTRTMIWVGQRAYAVYLIHMLCLLAALHAARKVVGTGLVQDSIVLVVGLAASLVAAEFLRRRVELPMIDLGRRFASERRAKHPIPAQAEA